MWPLMRPPLYRKSSDLTAKNTLDCCATESSLLWSCSNGTPASTICTARSTTMPATMPMERVSTTMVGKSSIWPATMWAVWFVAESALAMVTTTAFW